MTSLQAFEAPGRELYLTHHLVSCVELVSSIVLLEHCTLAHIKVHEVRDKKLILAFILRLFGGLCSLH